MEVYRLEFYRRDDKFALMPICQRLYCMEMMIIDDNWTPKWLSVIASVFFLCKNTFIEILIFGNFRFLYVCRVEIEDS